MRGIGVALFLVLIAAGPGAPAALGGWSPQSSGVTTALQGVAFVNATEGFAVGAGGVIRRTLDGGATPWTGQTTDTTSALNAVSFGTPDAGLAVGPGGLILQTRNGSTGSPSTWTTVSDGILAGVAATDAMHAWTGSLTGKLRATSDGGNAWPIGNPGIPMIGIHAMSFLTTPTEGYWVGDAGTAMKTVNGTDWLPTGPTNTGNTLNAVAMVASSTPGSATGWIAGAGGVLRVTTNSGSGWSDVVTGTSQDLNGLQAYSATRAWAVGGNSTILTTADGTSWTPQTAPTAGRIL